MTRVPDRNTAQGRTHRVRRNRCIGLQTLLCLLVVLPTAAQSGVVDVVDTTATRAIAVTSTGLAVAVTQEGGLLRSGNHGATWTPFSIHTDMSARAVTTCDNGDVYVATSDSLFRSSDSALSWTPMRGSVSPDRYPDILCLPGSTDLLVGGELYLNALREDGTVWEQLFTAPYPVGTFVVGRSGTHKVAVGWAGCLEWSCGRVLISEDGGSTFTADSLWNPGLSVFGIAITETGIVYEWAGADSYPASGERPRLIPLGGDSLLVATDSGLSVSPDAGATWLQVSSPHANVQAFDAARFNDGPILAATSEGIVRIHGAVPTSVDDDDFLASDPVATLEVYPNPFRHSLRVRTTGATCSGHPELFDLTGRRTAILAGASGPGEWVHYDIASELPAGPYVVHVRCGDGLVSKLVLHL